MGIDVDNFGPEVITESKDAKSGRDRILKDELNELLEGRDVKTKTILAKIVLENLDCKKKCEVVVSKKYIDEISKELQKYGFTTQIKGVLGNKLLVTWESEEVVKSYEYESRLGLNETQLRYLYKDVTIHLKRSAKKRKRRLVYNVVDIVHGKRYPWRKEQSKYVKSQLKNAFYKDGLKVRVSIRSYDYGHKITVRW